LPKLANEALVSACLVGIRGRFFLKKMSTKLFHSPLPFETELGGLLPDITLAYTTMGTLNAEGTNAVWVCHAFTGSHWVAEWWSGVVGPGKLLDPDKYFIVCANVLGSHYGSTGPLSTNSSTGEAFYHDFPEVTIRDVIQSFERLRQHLRIGSIHLCIGGSLGGQQAVEWAIMQPDLIQNLVLIASNSQHSPWGIAFNESQRMAIQVDPTWRQRTPEAGLEGMKAARAVALLSYRNYETYDTTQARHDDIQKPFRAVTYQHYQGEKLATRFNAFSYWYLSKMMDSQDVGRGRGGVKRALAQIKARTLVMGIKSDTLFPINEQRFLAENIPGATFQEIDSLFGHDGFLIENELITKSILIWQKFTRLDSQRISEVFERLDKQRLATTEGN
jgi:homoserine O-acetyltransferase/O-succinyltransferase